MARLYTPFPPPIAAAYADLENHAVGQAGAPMATPGSLLQRSNAGGFRFYAVQQYDASGKRTERYLAGPIGEPAAEATAEAFRRELADARQASESIRLLLREGYFAAEPRHYGVLAALANHGAFAGGALLVGTYAFQAIANRLGIRTSAFPTEDLDLARPSRLAMTSVPPGGLLEIIRASGVDFVEVPNLDPRHPPVKFKEKGRSRFMVDLLVPGEAAEMGSKPVPELKAHATAVPYLRYLVSESQPGLAMSRMGVAAIRMPTPERMAWHKMAVAQMRTGFPEKSRKDLRQAAVLVALLGETNPASLMEAFARTPLSLRSAIRKSVPQVAKLLADHGDAVQVMESVANAKRERKSAA